VGFYRNGNERVKEIYSDRQRDSESSDEEKSALNVASLMMDK